MLTNLGFMLLGAMIGGTFVFEMICIVIGGSFK